MRLNKPKERQPIQIKKTKQNKTAKSNAYSIKFSQANKFPSHFLSHAFKKEGELSRSITL